MHNPPLIVSIIKEIGLHYSNHILIKKKRELDMIVGFWHIDLSVPKSINNTETLASKNHFLLKGASAPLSYDPTFERSEKV